MLTKSKIALAAAFVTASASMAFAQGFDPNPQNRYPAYAGANYSAPYIGNMMGSSRGAGPQTFQSAPVGLYQGRNAAPGAFYTAPVAGRSGQQDPVTTDLSDRASSPFAGGVN